MPTNPFFMSAFFGVSGAARGLSQLDVPFPPVQGEGPSPGLHRPLRACVRELSTMSRNTTSKTQLEKSAFFDGGSRYGPGKGKRLPTFFTPKSEVFCGVAEPLAVFSLGGPVNFWVPPACSNNRNVRSVRKTKKEPRLDGRSPLGCCLVLSTACAAVQNGLDTGPGVLLDFRESVPHDGHAHRQAVGGQVSLLGPGLQQQLQLLA